MKRKILGVFLAAAMVTSALVGCGETTDTELVSSASTENLEDEAIVSNTEESTNSYANEFDETYAKYDAENQEIYNEYEKEYSKITDAYWENRISKKVYDKEIKKLDKWYEQKTDELYEKYYGIEDVEIEEAESSEEVVEQPKEKEWKAIAKISGDLSENMSAQSDIFEITTGKIRIRYDVEAESVGGNFLAYVLKEGESTVTTQNGEIKIASEDLSAIGTQSGTRTIKKKKGSYYLLVNMAGLGNCEFIVEEYR